MCILKRKNRGHRALREGNGYSAMKITLRQSWDDSEKVSAAGRSEAVLAWAGEYMPGDYFVIEGLIPGHFYDITIDEGVGPALVLAAKDTVRYTIPFYEKKRGHNPLAFVGNRHYARIREADAFELGYRNLAVNPMDLPETDGLYPHASANIETRGEAVFAARNAIDGIIATSSHGEWPYASWGINRDPEACLKLEFGRPVNIDEIRLYTRADFPHDSWWTEGTFTFSDGEKLTVHMEKKAGEPHVFRNIGRRNVTWLTLDALKKADDPSPFPALTQIEVYGTESGK